MGRNSYRLRLLNEQPATDIEEINVGMTDYIPVSITFEIADIIDPEKRRGSKTKTVNIPGTKEVNRFFENSYDANIALQNWNPNKVVSAYYYKNEVEQFSGRLQLLKIQYDQITKEVIYECQIAGPTVGLFADINTKTLTSIDWDNEYPTTAHNLTGTNVIASWANAAGSGGYVYPLIDWGVNNSNLTVVKPTHLRACLFAWDYWNRILTDAGYTWDSAFIDGTFFKKLIIPPVDFPSLTDVQVANNKFLASVGGAQVITKTLTYTTGGLLSYTTTTPDLVQFPTETYDAGSLFDNVTNFDFIPSTTNTYNMSATLALNIVVKKVASDISSTITGNSGYITVAIYKGSSIIGNQNISVANFNFAASNSNTVTINLNNYTLTAGQLYTVKVTVNQLNLVHSPDSGSGTYSIEFTATAGTFSASFASNAIYEGISVTGNSLIPPNIKQSDFISSIIRMFNLYVMPDKYNPKNLIIEPRETFFSGTAKDWTKKRDYAKKAEVIPMGELNVNRYQFTYKSDTDFYNALYNSEFSEVYGYSETNIDNDFVRGDKKTEVIFSPTPYAKNPYFGLVCPAILKKDNNLITPHKGNIRILYWSGVINLPQTSWTLNAASGVVTYTTFPAAGHTNSPYAPTLDLNWGLPRKVFYEYPNLQWTTNNLKNKYYSQMLNQISDKDSKIIRRYYALTENDINELDFRCPIWDEDAYYILNKIPEYDPTADGTYLVELVKLTDYDQFVTGTYPFDGGVGGVGDSGTNFIFNQNMTSGPNNINYGETSSIIGGSGNFIANG